jgi:anaerobic ribonucleoside-triphosphate reductase
MVEQLNNTESELSSIKSGEKVPIESNFIEVSTLKTAKPLVVNIDFSMSTKRSKIIEPTDILPQKVENTDGMFTRFDGLKIMNSIVKETGILKKDATEITYNVLRQLAFIGKETVTGPMIREIACYDMLSKNMLESRNKYTRSGLPVYDIGQIIKSNEDFPMFVFLKLSTVVLGQYMHLTKDKESVTKLFEFIVTFLANCKDTKKVIEITSDIKKIYTMYALKEEGKNGVN